jgi:DNA-directed RNA polymerase III subunit RPC6
MLYDQTPTKEITGGPWYTDQDFDQKFTEELGKFIVKAVGSKGRANINEISEMVRNSGAFKVELREEDIALILNTLVYDGDLDEIGKTNSAKYYQKVKNYDDESNRIIKQEVPCLNCPVISQCVEGGLISPTTCEYLQKWLKTDLTDLI